MSVTASQSRTWPTAGLSVDRHDILAAAGLALLNWGLWMIWPPLAPTVTGILLLGAANYAAIMEVRHGTTNQPGTARDAGDD